MSSEASWPDLAPTPVPYSPDQPGTGIAANQEWTDTGVIARSGAAARISANGGAYGRGWLVTDPADQGYR